MTVYDEKIKSSNLKALREIMALHERALSHHIEREARECYLEMVNDDIESKLHIRLDYMELVHRAFDSLAAVNQWSGEFRLKSINRDLLLIRDYTSQNIKLFSTVGESR